MALDDALIIELLKGAVEALGRTQGWTRGHQARTREGAPTWPEAADARCFCAFGVLRREALRLAEGDRSRAAAMADVGARYLGSVLKQRGLPIHRGDARRTVIEWNDAPGRTQLEVLELYRVTLHALLRRDAS